MPPADRHPGCGPTQSGVITLSDERYLTMPITLGQYNFDGPFTSTGQVMNRSGVYAVLTRSNGAASYNVVDIGESGDVRSRLDTHDRSACWTRNNVGQLSVAILYCDERTRMLAETALRARYSPVCGVR